MTILKTAAGETKGQLDSSGLCDLINFRKNCQAACGDFKSFNLFLV